MSKKLFVGNLDWNATEDDLRTLFAPIGEIEEAVIIKDRMSGRSKGFAFVTYVNDADGDTAIQQLNGQEMNQRKIVVNEARPQKRDRF
ncbi:MAG: hypothetical protein A3F54_00080 [Candidatus Kerfeldbacteria bacterium RIFCSPHIGHO2_12_FULL_48_17]|uniref:RRM domain-containing protein n=1 Tax=Candidatus Kerfeldbacteria bacterium RIFCSPHIGHO2_12_FULL_48_17 TaxID=1798542 RepID=A0A1G2B802_9BACT|nr:MAG: hypothetical protein A3F54_00080 [Candidatus Kerfeldbacteria bacterium RIFCSPHIGHO2_12_FULL_48_17]